MQRPAAQRRHVVSGKLHHERRGTACEQASLLEHDARDTDREPTAEVEQRGDPACLGIADQRAHDQRNDRELGACEQAGLLEHDARDDDREHTEEVEQRGDPACLGIADQRAHDQRNDRELGAAGNERGSHDRQAAVLLVLDRLGGEYTGNAAARGYEHGNERLALQAEATEDAVHDKRHTRHVAAVLEEGQQP